uniref:Glycoprotein n=1 Tax=Mavingoni virus TaxID=2603829 RepID=A0A5B9BHN5_9RHAB|nr:glycoprotein [Mavingoni virus]
MIFIVIAILCISPILAGRIVNIPVDCKGEREISKLEVRCPIRRNELSVRNLREYEHRETICRASLRDSDSVEGYLCVKQRWITKCEETWYFTTYTSYRIEERSATYAECLQALNTKNKGKSILPFYVPSTCYWNMINEQYEDFIILTDHPIYENPHDGKFYDSLFLSPCQITNERLCATKHDSILWIPKNISNPHSEHCNIRRWECLAVKVFEDFDFETGKKELVIEAPELGRWSLGSGCKMSFCYHKGVRFPDGEWWAYHEGSSIGLQELRNCEPNELAGYRSHLSLEMFDELDIQAQMEHERCLRTLEKIQDEEPISILDMSHLSPSSPGKDYAYRFEYETKVHHKCLDYNMSYSKPNCNRLFTDDEGTGGGYYNWTASHLKTIKRAHCQYVSGIENETGIWLETYHGGKPRFQEINLTEFKREKIVSRDEDRNIGYVSWNGITTNCSISEHDNCKIIVPTLSVQNQMIDEVQVAKFEIVSYKGYVMEQKLMQDELSRIILDSPIIDEEKIKRVDFIDKLKEGGSYIISGVMGWFTGIGKVVKWAIWIIGGIVSAWAIWKLRKLIVKTNSKNQDSVKRPNQVKRLREEQEVRDRNIYEDIDMFDV